LRDPDSLSDAIKIAEHHDSITLPYQKKVIDPIKKAQTTVQDFGSTPIEIDSRKKPAWRNPICYLCDEAGHVVKNCPLKKQLKKSLSSVNKKVVTRYHQQNKAIPQNKNINIKSDTDNNELLNIYEDKPSKLFVLKGVISQVPARILIDSGAAQNFISARVAKKIGMQQASPGKLGNVVLADGTELPCDYYIEDASIQVGTYKNKMNFFVTKIKYYDAVFGKTWLEEHNPIID